MMVTMLVGHACMQETHRSVRSQVPHEGSVFPSEKSSPLKECDVT